MLRPLFAWVQQIRRHYHNLVWWLQKRVCSVLLGRERSVKHMVVDMFPQGNTDKFKHRWTKWSWWHFRDKFNFRKWSNSTDQRKLSRFGQWTIQYWRLHQTQHSWASPQARRNIAANGPRRGVIWAQRPRPLQAANLEKSIPRQTPKDIQWSWVAVLESYQSNDSEWRRWAWSMHLLDVAGQ